MTKQDPEEVLRLAQSLISALNDLPRHYGLGSQASSPYYRAAYAMEDLMPYLKALCYDAQKKVVGRKKE